MVHLQSSPRFFLLREELEEELPHLHHSTLASVDDTSVGDGSGVEKEPGLNWLEELPCSDTEFIPVDLRGSKDKTVKTEDILRLLQMQIRLFTLCQLSLDVGRKAIHPYHSAFP